MSDIKRLVSAATAQWLPVALGALAAPSGARHQWKSPQSQGPSVSVCVSVWNMVNVITGPVLWEPPWKGPHSEATKAPFCFSSLAFSLFIYLCVGEPDEEGGLSLSPCVLCPCLSLSDRQHDPSLQPSCRLDTSHHSSHYLKRIYWLCLTLFLWRFLHTSYQLNQIIKSQYGSL